MKKKDSAVSFAFVVNGIKKNVKGFIGECVLDVAKRNKVDIDNACEGNCACGTCHVVLDKRLYNALPRAKDVEEDLLECVRGLTMTSRLACQVKVTKLFDGLEIIVPKEGIKYKH